MSDSALYTVPIAKRTPQSWLNTLRAILFCVLFDLACLMNNGSQFVFLLPFRMLPFRWSRRLYYKGIRYTKGSFGCLLVLMSQWFAPTKLAITFETQGKGRFNPEDLQSIVIKNEQGEVVALDLPTKFVLTANHQIYADWWYAWCLTYFISARGVHRYIYITLKKSLQWVPVVGWGMQFFNFIFLARSWASDRVQLARQLASLGKEAEKENRPLCFLLYPEGTLVSKDTRPISKKFADKMGISDMKNILLPRSTGLHYSLRSLAPRVPKLHMIDITVVYPGIPPMAYGQDYYTLRSIFFDGVPPPVIHMHLRLFNVTSDVPIGDLSETKPASAPPSSNNRTVEVDIPEKEKDVFDNWLREVWLEKDASISRFHETGSFDSRPNGSPAIEIPLRLRQRRQILDAFCFFLPAAFAYLWGYFRR
ncbi:acyltransferase-domain-containing protein [Cyathus striatus]|nr:acyltransferase-domain-containing protein [Cyathus striatus]